MNHIRNHNKSKHPYATGKRPSRRKDQNMVGDIGEFRAACEGFLAEAKKPDRIIRSQK